MPNSRGLLVVRGSKDAHTLDSTFACVAHSDENKAYVALELDKGRVVDREIYPHTHRRELENRMHDPKYGSVLVDSRSDAFLLPLTPPDDAMEANLEELRRSKSDLEIRQLQKMDAAICTAFGDEEQHIDKRTFRGTIEEDDLRSAFQRRECKNRFVEYRGGARNPHGLTVELSTVVPLCNDWERRIARAENGFRAVAGKIAVGAKRTDLDREFMHHMDPDDDIVYGSVVHHTGYDAWEHKIPLETLEKYDYVTLGITLSDTEGNTAHLLQSTTAVV